MFLLLQSEDESVIFEQGFHLRSRVVVAARDSRTDPESFKNIGIFSEKFHQPCKSSGRRIMAGDEKSQDVVFHLFVGEFFVAGFSIGAFRVLHYQGLQKVIVKVLPLASPMNYVVQHFVHPVPSLVKCRTQEFTTVLIRSSTYAEDYLDASMKSGARHLQWQSRE